MRTELATYRLVEQCLNQLHHRLTPEEQPKLEFNWHLHWDCLRQQ